MELTNGKILLIFAWVYIAMIANSFWESYLEGRDTWDKHKFGWSIKLGSHYVLPAYHVYLFIIMWPMLLLLPMIIYGWNTRLFGVLLSAYFSGLSIEDFFWYVVNPIVKFKEFTPRFAKYYPWIVIGRFKIPAGYVISVLLAVISWLLFWKQ